MPWPDENVNRDFWDFGSGKTTLVSVSRYELVVGTNQQDIWKIFDDRTQLLLKRIEELEAAASNKCGCQRALAGEIE